MAIRKSISVTRFGGALTIENAYCFAQDIKVVQVDRRVGSTETGSPVIERAWRVRFALLCYTSREAKDGNASPVDVVLFDEPVPAGNALNPNALAYVIAKESELFSGGVDV